MEKKTNGCLKTNHASGKLEKGTASQTSVTSRSSVDEVLPLTQEERQYLLYVQRGDVASVKRLLEEGKHPPNILDINCTDPLGRSAVAIAIENENIELLQALLEFGVLPKDSLLLAISEQYVEGVELLLQWEEKNYKPGQSYSWEKMTYGTAVYTSDITPLILAAHHDHYEILKLLLDRGASIPTPHHVKCGCDECVESTKEDSLSHSLSRINSYKALASPSLISLSSKDPLLTAFELSTELKRLERMENEFKTEYSKLRQTVKEYSTNLLDQVRSQRELSVMLNYSADPEELDLEEPQTQGASLSRLKLAIKSSQKSFVAHSNVQQLLGAIWYNGLPGFRRLPTSRQILAVLKLSCLFPVLSLSYVFSPNSERALYLKKPFVKFICHCSSYMFFLSLLALASQRIEFILIEMVGNEWLLEVVEDWKKRERGSLPGPVDALVIIYVFGLVWSEAKALWNDGLLEYLSDLWNIVDFITNSFFMAWIQLRAASWFVVRRDIWWYDKWPWYPREQWHDYDPMLISEGCFGAAMIFSPDMEIKRIEFLLSAGQKISVSLLISLGRMIFDILKFFFLYTLVLFAFGCGESEGFFTHVRYVSGPSPVRLLSVIQCLNQMLWYYAELEMNNCYHLPGGKPDYEGEDNACVNWRRFASLFESSQSLYWASFGLVELEVFDLTGVGSFTRFWSLLMFGGYSTINVIVLLNLLIAMMSNSYQAISAKSDTEWKFARTKLWISYFEDGGTVPPPFNLIPTVKTIRNLFGCSNKQQRGSFKEKSRKKFDRDHQDVMRLLVRRYVTERQRLADERKVTEDDVSEIKQDISTFRFQLIDILKNNGMNTSIVTNEDPTVIGRKGRAMERKLMKGFNIGKVEGIIHEILSNEKKPVNVFSKIAKALGSGRKRHGSKTAEWNAKVSQKSMKKDQIGSSQLSLNRSVVSIQRRIQHENELLLQTMNPASIAEYNPNLENHTDQTKIAYAKFKVNTINFEKRKKERLEKMKNDVAPNTLESEIQTNEAESKTGNSDQSKISSSLSQTSGPLGTGASASSSNNSESKKVTKSPKATRQEDKKSCAAQKDGSTETENEPKTPSGKGKSIVTGKDQKGWI